MLLLCFASEMVNNQQQRNIVELGHGNCQQTSVLLAALGVSWMVQGQVKLAYRSVHFYSLLISPCTVLVPWQTNLQ